MLTPDMIRNDPNLTYHHTATGRGYVSRKCDGIVETYSGHFGTGYIIKVPRFDTSNYCYIEYWVRET